MQVTARIRTALSIELPVSLLFSLLTLRRVAAHVDDLRGARLVDAVAEGGDEMETLLSDLASMPESRAQELIRELTMRGKL
jgi:hypothetical protein